MNWFQKHSCKHGVEEFKIDTGANYNIISYILQSYIEWFIELGFIKKAIALQSY